METGIEVLKTHDYVMLLLFIIIESHARYEIGRKRNMPTEGKTKIKTK